MADLPNPIFTDEDAARKHFEATRWPDGPYCPLCGSFDKVKPFGGKSMGPGWYYCSSCRRKFTATMGTICERSHIPLTKWLLAMHLLCGSKKGVSSHQLHLHREHPRPLRLVAYEPKEGNDPVQFCT